MQNIKSGVNLKFTTSTHGLSSQSEFIFVTINLLIIYTSLQYLYMNRLAGIHSLSS